MKILGIESSCDETAVAIVDDGKNILSNIVFSQTDLHRAYGGVVPEVASRSHVEKICPVVDRALCDANLTLQDIDGIAVASGPGLIGGVIVGLTFAKALAFALNKPLIAINHLEGHLLTARLTEEVTFPFLNLLVSGGHCQIIIAKNLGEYKIIGKTLDDALGEAFDKLAKMMGLPYPGGPVIEKLATQGREDAYNLPSPLYDRPGCDFSFSGLKTHLSYLIEDVKAKNAGIIPEEIQQDIAASFQKTCCRVITKKMQNAITIFKQEIGLNEEGGNFDMITSTPNATPSLEPQDYAKKHHPNHLRHHKNGKQQHHLIVSGGVAANLYIREGLKDLAIENEMLFYAPPVKLCTDNGAMIAWAGVERMQANLTDGLNAKPKARWSIEDL